MTEIWGSPMFNGRTNKGRQRKRVELRSSRTGSQGQKKGVINGVGLEEVNQGKY